MSLKIVVVVVVAFTVGGAVAYYLSGSASDEAAGIQPGQIGANTFQTNSPDDNRASVNGSQTVEIVQNQPAGEGESSRDQPNLSSDDRFSSPQQLNAQFINANGSLSSRSLGQALRFDDFDEFVQRVREAGSSRESTEREIALMNQLTDVFGSSIYQSSHACSGEVCTVVFRSTSELSEADTYALGTFAENNHFISTRVNDYGDTEFRGIYIRTDNPGEMFLDPR